MEVLHSLMGINMRLNQIISDPIFTNCLTLLRLLLNHIIHPLAATKLDRFCSEILPQIDHHVKWLNVEPLSMKRVLLTGRYSNLYGLGIFNINEETFQRVLADENPLSNIFKNQISKLVLTITVNRNHLLAKEVSTTLFTNILSVLINLRYLEFRSPFPYECNQRLSFQNKSPIIFSPTLLELYVSVSSFDDCLYLLDGRFNQLRTFCVKISHISPARAIDDKKELPNLRTFSVTCYTNIISYEKSLLPLLHRMISLEKLSLDMMFDRHVTFIDGNDLMNMTNHLTQLNQFTFHIRSIIFCDNVVQYPSNEEIQNTLTNLKQYQIISTVDYFPEKGIGQCHIYSYPYTMNCYHHIANSFPGGFFKSVRKITLFDERPFEHHFFMQIAQAFPLIQEFYLSNRKAQQYKQYRKSVNNEKHFPLIEYPRLRKLQFMDIHKDYLQLFLDHTKTSLPDKISLNIDYAPLRKVTHYFTRDVMRVNCAKVTQLRIYGSFQISEYLKAYFPHVKKF